MPEFIFLSENYLLYLKLLEKVWQYDNQIY